MPLTREQCTTTTIQYLTMPLNREQCTTKTMQHNTMPVIPPFLPPSVPRPRHFSGAGRTIRREAGGAATALYYLSLRTQATTTATQCNSNGLQLFNSSIRRCLSNCQGPDEHQSNYDQRYLTTQAFTNPTYNRSENYSSKSRFKVAPKRAVKAINPIMSTIAQMQPITLNEENGSNAQYCVNGFAAFAQQYLNIGTQHQLMRLYCHRDRGQTIGLLKRPKNDDSIVLLTTLRNRKASLYFELQTKMQPRCQSHLNQKPTHQRQPTIKSHLASGLNLTRKTRQTRFSNDHAN